MNLLIEEYGETILQLIGVLAYLYTIKVFLQTIGSFLLKIYIVSLVGN